MIVEIKIPEVGESVTEVELAEWLVNDGDYVEKDQEIAEIESDKALLSLIAEESGKINIIIEEGSKVKPGAVACKIDTSAKPEPASREKAKDKGSKQEKEKEKDEKTAQETVKEEKPSPEKENKEKPATEKEKDEKPSPETEKEEKPATESPETKEAGQADTSKVKATPLARSMMKEKNLSVNDIINGLRKITGEDVEAAASSGAGGDITSPVSRGEASREESSSRMSTLRRKLSERLVAVKNETAMLTTFTEADMSNVMEIRKKYQKKFTDKHGVKLGLMSFFVKAAVKALELYPLINSRIEGENIVTPEYCDIGIAVQTDKGLMVPVIRNAETMGMAEIEKNILELAEKARKKSITPDEMAGGTFTITNGGIFGSLLSTPLINPPQSAILGMHKIEERPVAVNARVEIRQMMYLALSYDHRTVDGRDSVGFLVKFKEMIENPAAMLTGGHNPAEMLLDI